MPRNFSSGTGEPVAPAPQVALAKPNCSIATAAARVTTARLTPRTRSAEAPATKPSAVAASVPAMAASGKPMPASLKRCDTTKPEAPASATCMSDTWPMKPVMTT